MRSFLSKSWACVTDTSVKCLGLGLMKAVICSQGEVLSQLTENFMVPYIVTHLILGVTRVEPNILRKIFFHAVVYFISTTALAITVGLTLSMLIKPGISGNISEADDESLSSVFAIMDLIRNMVPDGLALASFQQHKTWLGKIVFYAEDLTSATGSTGLSVVRGHINEVNILGLVIWSIIISLCLKRAGEEASCWICASPSTPPWVNQFNGYRGLLFMTARYIDEVGFSWETLIQFGKFTGVVVFGLAIHVIVVLVLIYLLFVRRNPFTFIWGVCPALLMAMCSSQQVHLNSPVNILGDCTGAVFVEQLSRNELDEMDEQGRDKLRVQLGE